MAIQTPARVAIYYIEKNKRSKMIASAMLAGLQVEGETGSVLPAHCYRRPEADIAVFYGYDQYLRCVMADYRAAGKSVVYIDLGYWGRRDGGPLAGYHKVAVNGRHPTDYFQSVAHEPDRANRLGLAVKRWRPAGDVVLVAGMSAKCAEVEGYFPNEWETRTIRELRRHTDRPIVYRPKPSWAAATPIPGAEFSPGPDELPFLLSRCHAVVTHHSNVAVDALLEGVPAFTTEGAASSLCHSDLSRIESPLRPGGRRQLVNDLSYCQFTPAEMRDGTVWRHLKSEGLIT